MTSKTQPDAETLRILDPAAEPVRTLATFKKRALAEVTKEAGSWHALQFCYGIAVALVVLDRREDALALLRPMYTLQGTDAQGNLRDIWAHSALAYSARLLRTASAAGPAQTEAAAALDAQRSELCGKSPPPSTVKAMREWLAEIEQKPPPPLGILCTVALVTSSLSLRAAQGQEVAACEALLASAQALLKARLGSASARKKR